MLFATQKDVRYKRAWTKGMAELFRKINYVLYDQPKLNDQTLTNGVFTVSAGVPQAQPLSRVE